MPAELLNQASSAGTKSLCNHANAPQHPRAAQAFILRPKGRPIKLQEDMGLANNRTKFLRIRVRGFWSRLEFINMSLTLIFKCTIKDALKRAGLDPNERWECQPKDKLARIYWVVSSCHQLWPSYGTELTRKVKERQPYMARFAHNWPIEEYIKRHHKNVRAYLKKLDDGTNATLPDVDSEEFSDVQEKMASGVGNIDSVEIFWQWMRIHSAVHVFHCVH